MTHSVINHIFFLCVIVTTILKANVAIMEQQSLDPYATIFYYSGLPNPRWQLSLDEWQQLNQLIHSLPNLNPENQGPYEFDSQLGYSGFYAHFSIVSSYPDVYYVAMKRQAVISNPGGHVIFNDEHRSIETWFIDSAKRHEIPLPPIE